MVAGPGLKTRTVAENAGAKFWLHVFMERQNSAKNKIPLPVM